MSLNTFWSRRAKQRFKEPIEQTHFIVIELHTMTARNIFIGDYIAVPELKLCHVRVGDLPAIKRFAAFPHAPNICDSCEFRYSILKDTGRA